MADDPNITRTSPPLDDDTFTFDAALDAGLAAAFTSDLTPSGWSVPPQLRDDPSDIGPEILANSSDIPKADPGRYQYLGEIARGGMGVVLKGRDPDLGRDLAVKVLKTELVGRASSEQRFVEEAQVSGQLQHPGIVPVYELGRFADGRPFFTMKLVKGRTLAALLADRPDPSHDRAKYLQDFLRVCEAVAYAHTHGVIHRDLKPSNIMVGNFGEVQVMDWGLAKVLQQTGFLDEARVSRERVEDSTIIQTARAGSDSATQAGSVLGTLAFMPPEQAGGEIDKLDERADVFGLGALLCVILTGEPPYVGLSSEAVRLMAVRGQLTDAFARLDECGAEAEFVALCKRCLDPNRDARPRNADVVTKQVSGIFNAAQDRARRAEIARATAEAKTTEERKRRKVQVGLVMTLALVAGLIGFGVWWQDQQATRRAFEQAAARTDARQKLEAALDRAESAFREDQLSAADAALDLAAGLFDSAEAPNLRSRYDDLRADRAVVAEFDRIWVKSNVMLDERVPGTDRRAQGLLLDLAAARNGYPPAFTARGLVVGKTDPDELAARISESPIRDRFIAALDDWLPVALPEDRARLRDLLALVDPDPARNAVRQAHVEPERLKSLFANPPAESALKVAARVALFPVVPNEQALTVLRAAVARHPNDFRIQYIAGARTANTDLAAGVGYFRAAYALHPGNLAAMYGLATVLYSSGKPNEAIPLFLRVIELDPGFASAYLNLADAIKLGADPKPAIAYFEREVANHPNQAMAHFGLGMALREPNPERAVGVFRRSLELDETNALAHNYLGYVLEGRAPRAERMKCYRRAIELDPGFAFPHYNLGLALRAGGDVPGALAEFRKAIDLKPDHTFSHFELGKTLADQSDLPGASMHLARTIAINKAFASAYPVLGHVLLRANDPVGAVNTFQSCVERFPSLYAGHDGLLQALIAHGANAEAVRVYHVAVTRASPKWPVEVRRRMQYNAACAAALAADGAGRDAPPPADRPVFRRLAFEYLVADFVATRQLAATNRAFVHQWLTRMLADADLASIRDRAALEKLSPDEQAGWVKFWTEVRALRDATAPLEQAPRPRGVRS